MPGTPIVVHPRPGCSGHILPGENKKKFGPYYQWTPKRKVKQLRSICQLSMHVPLIQRAIEIYNSNRLMDILEEMRTLSLKIINETTTGVKRRKYASIHDFKN